MEFLTRFPAVPGLVALWAGVMLGTAAHALSVPGLCALVALGLAWRSGAGWCLVAGACGLLLGTFEAERRDPLEDATFRPLPVEVEGRLVGPWRQRGDGYRAWLDLDTMRRGRRLSSPASRLPLTVYGSPDPPALALPTPGSRIRALAELRRPPAHLNLGSSTRPGSWLPARRGRRPGAKLSVKSLRMMTVTAPPDPLNALAEGWRRRFEELYDRHPDSPGIALARVLVLGDGAALPLPWRRGLARAGLAHLTAVSGLHLGIVAALAASLTLPLPAAPRRMAVLFLCLAFGLLVGPRPSLLRALGMVLMASFALALRRPGSSANALAAIAAALIIDRPALVDDLGFQLTVTATAGLLLLTPAWAPAGASAPRRALAASAAAQIASWPVTLPAFGLLHPAAPLLNLVAVPWTALSLFGCLLWSLWALSTGETGRPLDPALLDALAWPFGFAAAGGPTAAMALPVAASPAAAVVLATGVALAIRWALLRRFRRLVLGIPLLLLAGGGPGTASIPPVAVTLLDVGQGDAVLLRDGERALLVDAPGWPDGDFGGRVLVPALAALGVTRLDALVMSHPDRDHCGGLVDLLAYLPVGEVWVGGGQGAAPSLDGPRWIGGRNPWPGDPCAARLVDAAGGRLRRIAPGAPAPPVGRWRFAALTAPEGRGPRDRNDRSLVLMALAEGRCLLLPGDIGAIAEAALLHSTADLSCDLLKVAHHGSRGSTGRPWLARVRPRWALISAGAGNSYGHPAADTLARLQRQRRVILSTARDGRITLSWRRGSAIRVEAPHGPRPGYR